MDVASGAPSASARFGARFLASLLDWVICFLIPSVVIAGFGLLAPSVAVLWVVLVPLLVVAYFTVFLCRGRTAGMRAASIRVVDRRTGRPPGVGRALARSLLALLQAAAFFALLNLAVSDRPAGGYSSADVAVLAASLVIAATSLVAHLWMFVDRERQTVLDRVFRLVIERRGGSQSARRSALWAS
jgi:uncharacterized RDD family membrane protein YckC